MILLEQAIALAAREHGGQEDKQGEPYILHLLRVMLAVSPGDERAAQIVAVLHDLIEDCGWTAEDLTDEGYGMEVVAALVAISRRPGETYFRYIQRVRLNPLATEVKAADLRDNLDVSRPIPASLRDRYTAALSQLEGEMRHPLGPGDPHRGTPDE